MRLWQEGFMRGAAYYLKNRFSWKNHNLAQIDLILPNLARPPPRFWGQTEYSDVTRMPLTTQNFAGLYVAYTG